jgi:hypothetical protein
MPHPSGYCNTGYARFGKSVKIISAKHNLINTTSAVTNRLRKWHRCYRSFEIQLRGQGVSGGVIRELVAYDHQAQTEIGTEEA